MGRKVVISVGIVLVGLVVFVLVWFQPTNPVDGSEQAFDDDFANLGRLQGNIGDQNYVIPADVDVSRYRSVVVWCDRFNAAFGAAPLA